MMNSEKKVNFAVLGYGHIGKRHARMIQENNDALLVAVCDVNQNTSGEVPFYTDLESMLDGAGKSADVICVCTPNGLHAGQSIRIIESHKHVVCEKPMALSVPDCKQMIEASQKYNRKIFCVMQNRYSPPANWLKNIVSGNILGDILMVRIDCFWNRDERYYLPGSWRGTADKDGGTLFTQFSHFIDLLIWIFDAPEIVHGIFGNFTHKGIIPFEDTGTIQFFWPGKSGMGVLNYSTSVWDQNLESSITVIGSKGSVQIAGQYMNEVRYCHIRDYNMPDLPMAEPPNGYGTYKGSAANHHFVIQNVVDTLMNKNTMNIQAEEGMEVVRFIEEAYKLRTFIL